MPVNLAKCDACGHQIVLAAYVPDLVNTVRSEPRRSGKSQRRASYMPLDVVPRDRDDEYANYALSAGRTTCHLITDHWPLDGAETRHTIHFATCSARDAEGSTDDHDD